MSVLNLEPYRQFKGPLPLGWDLYVGVDTATYMSAVFVVVPPGDSPSALAIAEFPNYRYVATEIELLGFSTPEWARTVYKAFRYFRPQTERCKAWADPNTQFRAELAHYGLDLRANHRGPELRVEITREYMQATNPERLYFAPWLSVLPYELEHAKWPEDTTSAGKFMRIKHHDHTLDCLEHALSRRPRGKQMLVAKTQSFLEQQLAQYGKLLPGPIDPHLGRL